MSHWRAMNPRLSFHGWSSVHVKPRDEEKERVWKVSSVELLLLSAVIIIITTTTTTPISHSSKHISQHAGAPPK
ncbi:hypothetical protein E2C01_053146 [Portunus trituberculatus]|uniref:Transmembrane protein n=1 Tax=Portunus trituberculatus TaxID=210409 RepID=A0A5B7GGB2_PORTR|nr:hypothetical protein [Portunus trituberculatus]